MFWVQVSLAHYADAGRLEPVWLKTSHSVVGRYERDEMIPSIEVAANMAKLVDTTVAYLLGEATDNALLKDQAMLKRLHDINSPIGAGQKSYPLCFGWIAARC